MNSASQSNSDAEAARRLVDDIFAVALRSFATGAVALVCLTISVIVAVTEPEHGYVLLALTVGVAAALAATVELIRAETVTA